MNEAFRLTLTDGYKIETQEERVDIFLARTRLLTKRQRRYTSAHRMGDAAVLTRHRIVCPCCRHSVPAYARFLNEDVAPAPRLPRALVEEWSSAQLSLYEVVPAKLEINDVIAPKRYHCETCGQNSTRAARVFPAELHLSGARITFTCENVDISILLALSTDTSPLHLPLTETTVFDLDSGTTTLSLTDSTGAVLAEQDVTCAPELWQRSTIRAVLAEIKVARRKLLRFFSAASDDPLPYADLSVEPEQFLTMTAFLGYPRSFYDAIPYDLNSGALSESFRSAVSRLHRADLLPRLYDASSLPRMKSVRRLLFGSPALFFYLPELELLWSIFGDPNLLRRFLAIPDHFSRLAFLRQYPGAAEFLRDYSRVVGDRRLLKLMEESRECFRSSALSYAAMSQDARQSEQARWRRERFPTSWNNVCYSLPMGVNGVSIPDCTVDGYRFTQLRTMRDHRAAGKALNNCLGEWRPTDNPVVVIRDKISGDCLAAIELEGSKVVQARTAHNGPIRFSPRLDEALTKWMELHSLTHMLPPSFDDDDDDELFF